MPDFPIVKLFYPRVNETEHNVDDEGGCQGEKIAELEIVKIMSH